MCVLDFFITPPPSECRKKKRPTKESFIWVLKKVILCCEKYVDIGRVYDLWHGSCELSHRSDRQDKGVTDVGLKQTKG